MRQLVLYVALVAAMSGCGMSNKDAAKHIEAGLEAVHANTQAAYDVAAADSSLDQVIIASRASTFEELKASHIKNYSELIAKLEQQEQRWKNFLSSLAASLGSSFPGGATVIEIANLIGGKVEGQSAQIKTLATKNELSDTKSQLERKIESTVSNIKEVERKFNILAGGSTDQDLLARLKEFSEVDLAQIKSDLIQEVETQGLLQNAEFKETFRAELLAVAEAKGFSADQLQTISELTDEELFMKYLGPGVGGSAGLLGLLALYRTFKSKDEDEINKIWARTTKIQTAIASIDARMTPTGGQSPVPTQPTTGQPATP